MFSFFNKKNGSNAMPTASLALLQCDMHSHILPGIDDGSPDVETSLTLIKSMVANGFTKLVCTPHIYKEIYPNTPLTIEAAYQLLLPHVQQHFPTVQLSYAAEYYMDDFFEQALANNEKLLTVHNNWVLVEHSFMQPPPELKTILFNMQMAGYTPILAHPERYEFFKKNLKAYDDLYDIGCIFQLNILSLIGYYGKVPQELAKYLIERKYVKLLGSDMHHFKHKDAMQHVDGNKLLAELQQQNQLLNSEML